MIELVKVIMLKGEKGDAGSSGDYAGLTNKPSINGVTLNGNKTAEDLNLAESSQVYTRDQVYRKDEVYNKSEVYSKSEVYAKGDSFPDYNSNWPSRVRILSESTDRSISIEPTEDCYLLVVVDWKYWPSDEDISYMTLSAEDEDHDYHQFGLVPARLAGTGVSPLYPIKAGQKIKIGVPKTVTGFYRIIPIIG